MRLLHYMPAAGITYKRPDGGEYVRDLIIDFEDHQKPDVGRHDDLRIFGLILTDADVYHENNVVHICLSSMNHVQANFDSSICRTREYQFWMGDDAPAPSADAIIQAHILKGHLPNLHKDYDDFVEYLFRELAQLPRINMDHLVLESKAVLYDARTKHRYDLWGMYRYWLMLDGNMLVTYSLDNQITINDPHISDKGVTWWLLEHNKYLMELAQENELLAAYITFGSTDARRQDQFTYTFVAKEGNYMQRPVDVSEFMHLAHHGHFPEVICADAGKNFNMTFNYAHFFPEAYIKYQKYSQSEYYRNLSRFV